MSDEINKYLSDILLSINRIDNFIGPDKWFENYQANEMLRQSVERNLGIIGEALNQLVKINPDISISNAKKMVSVRNRLIHAYDEVDDGIIWAIVINHLPNLKLDVEKLLKTNTGNKN